VLPYVYEAGIAFEAILFSLILAQRIDNLKALNTALKNQKILLEEHSHRIHENIQFIISLYRLKFSDTEGKVIAERLKESEHNIIAMSKVYESLTNKEGKEILDTRGYFQQLVESMRISFGEKELRLDVQCSVDLDADQAVYCGIILNEIVTNSVKYAFDGKKDRSISVDLHKDGDGILFTIADNGKGYDQKSVTEGFGLMMLHALVKSELKGSVEIESDKGTTVRIRWKR